MRRHAQYRYTPNQGLYGLLVQGKAAYRRSLGIQAESLEGEFEAWRDPWGLLVPLSVISATHGQEGTRLVTRSRPKVDGIACPWLIRRFVDPDAVFLFCSVQEVGGGAERFAAPPFDVEDVEWSLQGESNMAMEALCEEADISFLAGDLIGGWTEVPEHAVRRTLADFHR